MTRLVVDSGGIITGGAAQVGSVARHRRHALRDQLARLSAGRCRLEEQLDRGQLGHRLRAHRRRARHAVQRLLERHGDQRLHLRRSTARGRWSGSPRAAARTPGRRPRACRAAGRRRRASSPAATATTMNRKLRLDPTIQRIWRRSSVFFDLVLAPVELLASRPSPRASRPAVRSTGRACRRRCGPPDRRADEGQRLRSRVGPGVAVGVVEDRA